MSNINQQSPAQKSPAMNVTQEMYRFDVNSIPLPDNSDYTLHVKSGDAWLFIDDHDVILREGDTVQIHQSNRAKLRKLYRNAHVTYKLNQ